MDWHDEYWELGGRSPQGGRGLKFARQLVREHLRLSLPARGRGLKLLDGVVEPLLRPSLPAWGARIEIGIT